MSKNFVHLHVHSHYSLLDGLPKIPDLVRKTKELGMDAIALTDHGVMYGVIEFYKKARAEGIHPIIGEEFYLTPGSRHEKLGRAADVRYHLTLLAENKTGYQNLVSLTTHAHLEGFYYKPRIDKELLRKHHGGLICLSGCMNGEIPRTLAAGDTSRARDLVREYQEIFGKDNFFIEIWHHPSVPGSAETKEKLIELAREMDLPLVATHDVHYLEPEDKEAQDILVAVQTGSRVGEEDRLTLSLADLHLASPEEMAVFFKDTPEALENTVRIAQRCSVEIQLGTLQLPHFVVPNGKTPEEYMRELSYQGLSRRYEEPHGKVLIDRLEYELSIISKTGFAEYILIVQDFVNWAKEQGIVVGPGRGSAAGSLVAYLLGITNIDPIKYDLLFERFLNPDRIAMPDIDLDFADTRRDEVIAYVKEKYGTENVAQIITFGTMAARAAVRDTGRALGLSYSFCDMVAKLIPFNPTQGMKEGWLDICLKKVTELKDVYESNADAKKLIDAARRLEGVARHASIHAAGVVITRGPITEFVPLQRGTKGDETIITQYDMYSVETLGLLKMDFLGLKNLTTIEETLKRIHHTRGEQIDIENIPLDDKKTFDLLKKGFTTGVFQLESSGMKRYLKELKPTEFEDIIVMVSLYRPGPMELLPTYIRRKHGKEPVTYIHPKLEPILKNTYGVGVYQEQMMRIARDLAGFTLAEADTLRKAIGKKISKLLAEQKDKLISGMRENGLDAKTASAIWELFPPFARYGFNRSHAACYALIAYQTAYLKAHYTVEFMASLLNADSADVERIAYLTEETKSLDIEVLPPDINESRTNFATSGERRIRFGLGAIKNVGEAIARAIVNERDEHGPFASVGDVLARISSRDLNKKSLESMVRAGVFDSLEDRATLHSNIDNLLEFLKDFHKSKSSQQSSFFDGAAHETPPLRLKKNSEELPKRTKLVWEKELLGLYVSDHPLSDVQKVFGTGTQTIRELRPGRGQVRVGGIVNSIRKIVTKTGKPMIFAELEDLTGKIEVVVFPTTLEKSPNVWQEDGIVLLDGTVQERDAALKLICENVRPITV